MSDFEANVFGLTYHTLSLRDSKAVSAVAWSEEREVIAVEYRSNNQNAVKPVYLFSDIHERQIKDLSELVVSRKQGNKSASVGKWFSREFDPHGATKFESWSHLGLVRREAKSAPSAPLRLLISHEEALDNLWF